MVRREPRVPQQVAVFLTLVALCFGKDSPKIRDTEEVFGHAEGEKVGLVDFDRVTRTQGQSKEFQLPTLNKITTKIHGPPAEDAPWETYIEKEQYFEVNKWFSDFTAARKKELGEEVAAATVATVNSMASPTELSQLQDQGRAAADGCPQGVGSYGFGQMPNLCGSIVVDDNMTVVLMLNNLDYANRYTARDLHAWQTLERKHGRNKLAFGTYMDYNLCPRYSASSVLYSSFHTCIRFIFTPCYPFVTLLQGNFEGTRLGFTGQTGFSCKFADGTITQPIDKGQHEVTCTTVLTVWCPIPPKYQQQLRQGKKLVGGVQLISEHHDVDVAAGTTIYPVAQLCPQPPPAPKRIKLAGCAYFDPQFDSEANFEEWVLWNIAVGVGHVFVYYMEGSRPEFPSFKGPIQTPDMVKAKDLLRRAVDQGLVRVWLGGWGGGRGGEMMGFIVTDCDTADCDTADIVTHCSVV
jgi:hypothetical protein